MLDVRSNENFLRTSRYKAKSVLGYTLTSSSNLDDWTIHGLWPNRMSGGWPQYCTREQFDPNEIKDLIPEMDKDWPNLMQDRPHYDFWTHEYEKHGTCAETLPGK